MDGLTQKINRGGLVLRKYSPEILLGAGLVGIVTTIVMASKATLKVNDLMIEIEEERAEIELAEESGKTKGGLLYSKEDYKKDLGIHYVQTGLKFAKLYGPSVGLGVLSISAILASHGVMAKRQVALVAAYNLLNEGFKSYRAQVVEQLGEETDLLWSKGLTVETVTEKETDEEGKTKKVKKNKLVVNNKAVSIYSRFFDNSNGQWRNDRSLNKAFLVAQQNYMNDVLIIRGHVFLNEVYDALGFPHTKEGSIVGWVLGSNPDRNIGDGYIDFGMIDIDDRAGREFINGMNDAILLDFNVDGIIFDLI